MDYKAIIKDVTGLSCDSRVVKQGFLFAALEGVHSDGHDFIPNAVTAGATHVLAKRGTIFPQGVIGIESDNPRHDYALLAAAFYNDLHPEKIIAVTGTNGKTSVAEFLRQIFDLCGVKGASLGTLGLQSAHCALDLPSMTTPDSVVLHQALAGLKKANVDYLAMEASSHGLDQSRLDGVKLTAGVFTNLSQDHLDYHADMEDYFTAKSRLFTDLLDHGAPAIINMDDKWGQRLYDMIPQTRKITIGMADHVDLQLLSTNPTVNGLDVAIKWDGQSHQLHLSLIGLFQTYNVLCAAACAVTLGLGKGNVLQALPRLTSVRGRLEYTGQRDNGAAAYIDYAHTPDALEKALKALRPHCTGKLICVFGAGGDRDKGKRPLMGKAVLDHADIGIVTDDNPRTEDPEDIRAAVLAAHPSAIEIGDRRDAIRHGVKLLQKGDILLVAGKGHEQGQDVGSAILPFDDLSETRQVMEYDGSFVAQR